MNGIVAEVHRDLFFGGSFRFAIAEVHTRVSVDLPGGILHGGGTGVGGNIYFAHNFDAAVRALDRSGISDRSIIVAGTNDGDTVNITAPDGGMNWHPPSVMFMGGNGSDTATTL